VVPLAYVVLTHRAPAYTLDVSAASTAPLRVGVGSTNALVVNSSGQVGIGKTNPGKQLDVAGSAAISGTLSLGSGYSAAANGWTTLPGGIIMQWGSYTFSALVVNGGVNTTITFPIAFTSAIYSVTCTLSDVGFGYGYLTSGCSAGTLTLTNFDLGVKQLNGRSNSTPTVYWQAIGI